MNDIELSIAGADVPQIKVSEMTLRNFMVFIDGDIGAPKEYREVIHTILSCSSNDSVQLIINSTGGRLDTTLALIEAIRGCEGQVSAVVVGSAYSAASMLACSVPECYITESAEFMLHTANYGSMGTVPNVKNQTEFVTSQTHKLLDKIYKGFLTDKELIALKSGTEYWFNAEDAVKRMQRRHKQIIKELFNNGDNEEQQPAANVKGRGKRSKAKPVSKDQAGRHDHNPAKDSKADPLL